MHTYVYSSPPTHYISTKQITPKEYGGCMHYRERTAKGWKSVMIYKFIYVLNIFCRNRRSVRKAIQYMYVPKLVYVRKIHTNVCTRERR